MKQAYPKDKQKDISAKFVFFNIRGRKVVEINIWVKRCNGGIRNRHGVELGASKKGAETVFIYRFKRQRSREWELV